MARNGRPRMEDVAKAAGVSVATVSKVVNSRYGVSASTSARVLEVIEEFGYAASLGASSLRTPRTNIIGILVAEFEPFSLELLKGISEAAEDCDYELLAFAGATHGSEAGWESRSLGRLGGTLIDGAILVTPTVVGANGAVPVVAIDPHAGSADAPTVDSDNIGGARQAIEHLIGLGHRRIAMIGGREDLESAWLRERGYREAMAAAGLAVRDEWLARGTFRADSADQPTRELLLADEPPTAIFAANDLMAIRALQVAAELGVRVPEDVSIVGFDNIPESALSHPQLTTVAQPLHELGVRALQMLLHLLAGEELAHSQVRLPTRLVERGSTSRVR
ncbi:LacI family DNA-binding transcriptional regulator [Ornithinimicrobium sp. Y1694]|uniref:LacI family DNA-binding transcriptional regulator n=1 Tax=Ornithinimicrobium sp. Y1694 TaxID=3418590 RepID=UPI003CE962FD